MCGQDLTSMKEELGLKVENTLPIAYLRGSCAMFCDVVVNLMGVTICILRRSSNCTTLGFRQFSSINREGFERG